MPIEFGFALASPLTHVDVRPRRTRPPHNQSCYGTAVRGGKVAGPASASAAALGPAALSAKQSGPRAAYWRTPPGSRRTCRCRRSAERAGHYFSISLVLLRQKLVSSGVAVRDT